MHSPSTSLYESAHSKWKRRQRTTTGSRTQRYLPPCNQAEIATESRRRIASPSSLSRGILSPVAYRSYASVELNSGAGPSSSSHSTGLPYKEHCSQKCAVVLLRAIVSIVGCVWARFRPKARSGSFAPHCCLLPGRSKVKCTSLGNARPSLFGRLHKLAVFVAFSSPA